MVLILGKTNEEIEKEFEGKGYGDFKVEVAKSVITRLEPIQKKYYEIISNKNLLEEIYNKGAQNAKILAIKTLRDVKNKIGII